MKAVSSSLSFLEKFKSFEIPFFQRAYVWKKDNWEDLFNDLIDVKHRHFLGSIILKEIENPNSVTPDRACVIDGQQRLTTLSVLLKAIYDSFDEELKTNTSDNIKKNLFFKKKPTDSNYFIKIQHSKVDSVDFEKVIGGASTKDITSIAYDEVKDLKIDEEDPAHKILCCYKYFVDRLKDYSQDFLSSIFNNLLEEHNKMLVVIVLDEGDNEQQIFDTINSAGVRLTSTDIVKNALFQKIKDYNENPEDAFDFYEKTWGKIFSIDEESLSYWGKKKTVGRIQRDNSEMLLQSVAVIEEIFDPSKNTLADIPDLYKHYIDKMNENQVKSFVKKIIEYARIYRESVPKMDKMEHYSYNDNSKRLFHILDVLGLTTFTPYILFLLKKYEGNKNMLNQRMKELETFVVRRMIHHESASGYNKNCLEFIQDEEKAGKMAALIKNDEIFDGLKSIKNREATLLLFWIELKRISSSSKYDSKELLYSYTLEHIMPQKWEECWSDLPFVEISGKKIEDVNQGKTYRNYMVYSLGNMTLLKESLNKAIQNYDFKTKMKGTSKYPGVVNYASLSITSKDVIQDVYKKNKLWNEKAIFDRQLKLTKEILSMWSIGNDEFDIPKTFDFSSSKSEKNPFKKSLEKQVQFSNLRVIKDDGKIIEKETSADTFIDCLTAMANKYSVKKVVAVVEKLRINSDGEPVISKYEHKNKYASSHKWKNGYFVNTHANNNEKAKKLKKLMKGLNCNWTVEITK